MAALMMSQRLQASRVAGRRTTHSVPRVPSIVVRSVEQETTTETDQANVPAALDFTASRQGGEGYVEKDTAGQSNMYPTVTRPFEAGSAQDSVDTTAFNNGVAVGAAVLGVALVAAGLLANTSAPASKSPSEVVPQQQALLSLSQYSAKFSAELGLNSQPAPPVAVEEAAPAAAEPAASA